MVNILTKLQIDEISSVDRGAGEGCKIVLMKRDNSDDDSAFLFNDIMKGRNRRSPFSHISLHKADVDDDVTGDHAGDDDKKLSTQLNELVAEMIVAAPSLHPQRARRWLLQTPHGRELLAQHKSISQKEEQPMPQVNIFKLSNIESVREIAKHITEKDDITEFDFTKILMGHVRLNKRDNESDGAALERILTAPGNGELRQAYQVTKGFPNMMRTEPVSVEVGDTSVEDDSWKAADQLASLVAEQRALAPTLTASKLYERVYADPANKALVARAHKRPTASSVSTDYLER